MVSALVSESSESGLFLESPETVLQPKSPSEILIRLMITQLFYSPQDEQSLPSYKKFQANRTLCYRLTINGFVGEVRFPRLSLARDIVLYSWARLLNLTEPLSAQLYKWVRANLMIIIISTLDKTFLDRRFTEKIKTSKTMEIYFSCLKSY